MSEKTTRTRKHTVGMKENIQGFRKYMDRTLERVEVTGVEPLLTPGDRQFIIVCTHRSHLDYLLIASELEKRSIPNIRFAAGDNLTRLPILGNRFIKMGAFSVYRGKASQRSYLFKLTEQVKKLIEAGDTLVVFPEGGRSYTGHMLELKSGITGAAVVAQQENPDIEYCFMPVEIAYEIPPEVPYFKSLLKGRTRRDTGKTKLARTLGELQYYASDAMAFIKRGIIARFGPRFGRVVINFDKPIPVNSMSDVQGLYRESAKNSFLANRSAIKECADHLEKRLNQINSLFPHNILAYLIEQDNNLSVSDLNDKIVTLMEELDNKCGVYATENRGEALVKEGLQQLKRNSVVRLSSKGYKVIRPDLLTYFAAAVHDKLERN